MNDSSEQVPANSRSITLDDYQTSNLLALIRAIGYPRAAGFVVSSPLGPLNSGDWLGEIYWKVIAAGEPISPPNRRPEHMVADVVRWVRATSTNTPPAVTA